MIQRFKFIPQAIKFQEGKLPTEIQLFKAGVFYDERYGKVEIKPEDLASIKKNFDAKVRGVDIALDFSHDSEGPAAAWITSLSLKGEGQELWGTVDWTDLGKENINSKHFRYISPDFTFNYSDNETLNEFGPVLLGAGLTNRPVIKNMAPAIELTEYKGESKMSEKEMKEMAEKLAAAEAKLAEYDKKEKEMGEGKKLEEEVMVSAPEVAELMKTISEQKAKIEELMAALKNAEIEMTLAEKSKKFDVMLSEGKVCEAQRDAFLKDNMTLFLEKAQPVKLSEMGTSKEPVKSDSTAQDQVIKLAQELAKSDKITLSEAMSKVLLSNKELRTSYEKEVLI